MIIRSENHLRSLFIIFFAHKKMILIFTLLFICLTFLVAFLFPPVYEIQGQLIVKSKKIQVPPESISGEGYRFNVMPPSREDVLSEIEIITSHDLIFKSISALKESGNPITPKTPLLGVILDDYLLTPLKETIIDPVMTHMVIPALEMFGMELVPEERTEVEERTQEIVEIMEAVVVPGSNVIKVSFMYGDPQVGSDILNSIFHHYLPFRLALFTDSSQSTFFSGQIQDNQAGMKRIQEQKLTILKSVNSSEISKDIDVQMSLAEKLQRDTQTLRRDFSEEMHAVKNLNALFKEYMTKTDTVFLPFPHDFQDEEINRYSQRLNELVFDYHETLRVFHADTEKIQVLEDEIRHLRSVYTFLIKTRIEQEKRSVEFLHTLIADKTKVLESLYDRNQKLKEADIQIQQLDIEFSILSENYQNFFKKAEEFKISQKSELSQIANVQILSNAAIPDKPFFPQKKVVIPIGVVVSILISFSLGCIWEFFDHTFKTPAQVEQYLDLPIVGHVLYQKKS